MDNITNATRNETSITPAPYTVSVEAWIMYVTFYITLGFIAIGENLLITGIVIRNKKLHTFFFVLVGGHCLGEVAHSLGNVIIATYRLIPVSYPSVIKVTRLVCHTINILVYFAPSFQSITMLLLAADRSYAILKPMSYQRRTSRQGVITILIVFLITLCIKVGPSYTGNAEMPFFNVITCTTSRNGVTPDWWSFNYYINCTLVFAGVTFYIVLMVIAIVRANELKKGTFSKDESTNRFLQRQLKLLHTIKSLIIINITTVIPYTILLILSNYYPPAVASRLVYYGASMNAVNMAVEPVFLVMSSTEIKKSLLGIFGKVPNTVSVTAPRTMSVSVKTTTMD